MFFSFHNKTEDKRDHKDFIAEDEKGDDLDSSEDYTRLI